MVDAAGDLHQVDQGGDVADAVEAGQDAEFAAHVGTLDRPVVVGCRPAGRFVDSHDDGGGDEGGEQCHQHHDGERLVVEYLAV